MLPYQFESPYNQPKLLVRAIRHALSLPILKALPRTKVPNPFQVNELVKFDEVSDMVLSTTTKVHPNMRQAIGRVKRGLLQARGVE